MCRRRAVPRRAAGTCRASATRRTGAHAVRRDQRVRPTPPAPHERPGRGRGDPAASSVPVAGTPGNGTAPAPRPAARVHPRPHGRLRRRLATQRRAPSSGSRLLPGNAGRRASDPIQGMVSSAGLFAEPRRRPAQNRPHETPCRLDLEFDTRSDDSAANSGDPCRPSSKEPVQRSFLCCRRLICRTDDDESATTHHGGWTIEDTQGCRV